MWFVYNALLTPLIPVVWLYTLHRRFVRKRKVEQFHGSWGRATNEVREFGRQSRPKIWIHAVSVGEAIAARPIARALKERLPDCKIALSVTTDFAPEIARAAQKAGEVDCVFFFPLDIPHVLHRVLNALRPDAILFVETELWPNLLHEAHKRKIPTFLVNGRVSDALLASGRKWKPFYGWVWRNFSRFLMRGEDDAARLRTMGAPDQKISVTGDVKLDAPGVSSDDARREWRERLGLKPDDKLFIAGSIHRAEDAMILDVFRQLDGWKCAIAPRHIEAMQSAATLIEEAGWKLARRSKNQKLEAGAIYLLDTVGELADFYAAGEVAFVGGSLIERGGHNLIEPVLRGVPVVFGPNVANFRSAAQLVLDHDFGSQVQNTTEVAEAVKAWGARPRAAFQARVEAVLKPHRGAAHRIADEIAAQLKVCDS